MSSVLANCNPSVYCEQEDAEYLIWKIFVHYCYRNIFTPTHKQEFHTHTVEIIQYIKLDIAKKNQTLQNIWNHLNSVSFAIELGWNCKKYIASVYHQNDGLYLEKGMQKYTSTTYISP